MKKIAKQLTDLVGNTPLMEFSRFNASHDLRARVIGKLEYFNPAGSVKDRVALAMIEQAEADGSLKPGATIIEPTSGNTGIGLAFVSSVKGYKLVLTMPDTMSAEGRLFYSNSRTPLIRLCIHGQPLRRFGATRTGKSTYSWLE